MKILSICRRDYAGLAIRLTEAVNKHTPHEARLLTTHGHRFSYPKDIRTKDPNTIWKWINWADIVHGLPNWRYRGICVIHDKPLIWTHVGTSFRKHPRAWRFLIRDKGLKIRELTSASDLMFVENLTWLPSAIAVDDCLKMKTPHTGKPIVCQSPSNRRKKKTNQILAQIEHKENVDTLIIENKSWAQCMALKSKADIYVGQYSIGYGVGELEAMAMKIPVITKMIPPNDVLLRQQTEELPHYDCPIENLSEGINTLLSDKALYKDHAERCFKFVKKYYDYPVIAKKFVGICEEVLSGK